MNRILWIAAGGAAFIGAALLVSAQVLSKTDRILLLDRDADVVTLGATVYGENCASCHGDNLEGQPDWRVPGDDGRLPAPPHDASGHTWHHDGDTLFRLMKYGVAALINDPGYGSNMPIYDGILSDEEIIAVLSYIKSTWPDDIRARHDEMENGK